MERAQRAIALTLLKDWTTYMYYMSIEYLAETIVKKAEQLHFASQTQYVIEIQHAYLDECVMSQHLILFKNSTVKGSYKVKYRRQTFIATNDVMLFQLLEVFLQEIMASFLMLNHRDMYEVDMDILSVILHIGNKKIAESRHYFRSFTHIWEIDNERQWFGSKRFFMIKEMLRKAIMVCSMHCPNSWN
jgi:hypothetical protein